MTTLPRKRQKQQPMQWGVDLYENWKSEWQAEKSLEDAFRTAVVGRQEQIMTVPIKRAYYAVADLDVDDVDVAVLTPGGQELIVRRRTVHRRGQAPKTIWRARREIREPGQRTRFAYLDLPPHVSGSITRWRPLNRRKFPGSLPATPARIEGPVAWQSKPEPPVPPEPADELDWPHPYSQPPNISEREAEVRLLRGLRTERSLRQRKGGPEGFRDSLLIATLAGLGKLTYEHADESYAPSSAIWQPTRRDIGDELTALGWFVKLSKEQRAVIWLRSVIPCYSFRSIGATMTPAKSHEWARRKYRQAINALAKIANAPTSLAQSCAGKARAAARDSSSVASAIESICRNCES